MSQSLIHQMTEIWDDFPWQFIITLTMLSPFIDQKEELRSTSVSFFTEFYLGIRGPLYPAWGLDYMSRVIHASGWVDQTGCAHFHRQKEMSLASDGPMDTAYPVEEFPFSLIIPPIQVEMKQLILECYRCMRSNVAVDSIPRMEFGPRDIRIAQKDLEVYLSQWANHQKTEEETKNG